MAYGQRLGADRALWRAIAGLALTLAPVLAGCADDAPPAPPLEQARALLARGDGLGADVALQAAIASGTPRESVAALMGEAKLAQDDLPAAREWLEPGQFDRASRGQGFHMLGQLELASGNLAAAGRAFDLSLRERGRDPELWVDIARLRYRGGEQLQAIAAADRAVALGPRNPRALQLRGQMVRDAHGSRAALAWFDAGLAVSPDDPGLLADRAATLGELGRARDMLATVRHLARIDPGNPQIHYLQAMLAARAGQGALARSLLERSRMLGRNVPAAMLLSALIDLDSGNNASAAQTLAYLAARQPDNARVRTLLAHSLLLSRNEREVVTRFGELAARPGASPYLVMVVGRAYEALGEREQAAWFLDSAARMHTGEPVVLPEPAGRVAPDDEGMLTVARVRGAIRAGNAGEAVRIAAAFQRRFPGSADGLALLGDARLAAGDPGGALADYYASAAVRRPWPLVRRMIAAHRMAGEHGAALALLAAQVAGEPGNGEATRLLAAMQKE